MDVDALGDIRQGDDIDVVGGVGGRGSDGGRLDEAREAFAVAIDVGIDPVADGDGGARVGEGLVDGGRGVGNEGEAQGHGGRGNSGLHLGIAQKKAIETSEDEVDVYCRDRYHNRGEVEVEVEVEQGVNDRQVLRLLYGMYQFV